MSWNEIYIDQMGNRLTIPSPPKRIISIVPSQTELLYDLDLEDQVIGITKFCVHPNKWFRNKERIGGTKNLNIEKIRALRPDLIIGNKEENNKSDIEILQKEFPVWMSDIFELKDALQMIQCIGEITNKARLSNILCNHIKSNFNSIAIPKTLKNAVYLIWKNPTMCAGNKTFINQMLPFAGFNNMIIEDRYPQLSQQELQDLNPEILLLSSEPFPFKKKHIEEFQNILPDAEIKIVDGEMFSWYGSRLLKAPEYFKSLISQ